MNELCELGVESSGTPTHLNDRGDFNDRKTDLDIFDVSNGDSHNSSLQKSYKDNSNYDDDDDDQVAVHHESPRETTVAAVASQGNDRLIANRKR